ncbi:MAG: hypothetical protein ACE5DO_12010, partial [Desulfobacterales bacterium]
MVCHFKSIIPRTVIISLILIVGLVTGKSSDPNFQSKTQRPSVEQVKQVRMLQALEKFKAEFNQHRSQSLNPDQKQMNAKKPNLPNTPGFFAHHGSRQATRDVNRQLIFGSGRLSTHPDSLYFHFFSGMNGSDTTGMDVIL